jgi:hypothetical protein
MENLRPPPITGKNTYFLVASQVTGSCEFSFFILAFYVSSMQWGDEGIVSLYTSYMYLSVKRLEDHVSSPFKCVAVPSISFYHFICHTTYWCLSTDTKSQVTEHCVIGSVIFWFSVFETNKVLLCWGVGDVYGSENVRHRTNVCTLN